MKWRDTRVPAAGLLVAVTALTGCVGRDEATTEEIEQLATTVEAVTDDVVRGIQSDWWAAPGNDTRRYIGCGPIYPAGSVRFQRVTHVEGASGAEMPEVVNAVVDTLRDEGWTLGRDARAGHELTVITSDAGTITVDISIPSSTIILRVDTACLDAARDVVRDYTERDR